jgi:hypothetical protein
MVMKLAGSVLMQYVTQCFHVGKQANDKEPLTNPRL